MMKSRWRAPVDDARVYYAGQSLGGILGATLLATQPTIARAVLNVPGADLVDMFADSTWFGPQVRGFFTRAGIAADSYEAERFLDVARWIVDAVDPLNLGAATTPTPTRQPPPSASAAGLVHAAPASSSRAAPAPPVPAAVMVCSGTAKPPAWAAAGASRIAIASALMA